MPPAAAANEWVSLFDGHTLEGWTQLNGQATYEVKDGAIVGTTAQGSPNSFLCSDRFFGDFELEFDVKLMNDELNSGIQIRSHSIPTHKDGRVHGYQVEIASNGAAGFIYDEARRGWLSQNREDPVKNSAFQSGEWNRYRVVCLGPTIRTWINGVLITTITDNWSPSGFLGLQVHSVGGDPKWQVAWRNLRLRELGDGGGFVELFNGKDLSGWKVNENPDSVRVQDGSLVVQGDRAHVFYDGPSTSTRSRTSSCARSSRLRRAPTAAFTSIRGSRRAAGPSAATRSRSTTRSPTGAAQADSTASTTSRNRPPGTTNGSP